jgi:multidrug efflux pump subunit AcrB
MSISQPKPTILSWMAQNSVAANLLMIAFIVGGLISLGQITKEVFPEYDLDIIDISVSYPGTSPGEVERGVVLAIEEQVRAIDGVERVTVVSREGRANLSVELISGAEANVVLQDIKSSVDRISSLPDEAENPIINLKTRRREVVRLALFGDLDESALFTLGETVKEELISLSGITQVELVGVRKPELSIEVSQAHLRAYGLTLSEIAATIRNHAVDVPAGAIKARRGEILIRTTERRDIASEFADLALISSDDGTVVKVRDIATIRDGFAETDREAYYNGKRAVILNVFRTGEQTPQSVSKAVLEYIDGLRKTLPSSIGIEAYNDRSKIFEQRLRLLLKNGTIGLLLVLLTLGLFLEPRLAFWTSMGIPISIIGSLVILNLIGGSINMVSLFAFIITLGIVVDDAIVVGENIFYKRQQMTDTSRAAIEGVKEMAAPVMVAIATNIIAFTPLLFVSGSMGRFFAILPAVVISVFLISLVECLFILPAHLSYPHRKRKNVVITLLEWLPRRFNSLFIHFVKRVFSPSLKLCIRWRYVVAVTAASVLIVSYAYWDSGWINFSFRPNIQTDRIDAEIELPFGSSIEEVRKITKLVEEGGLRAIEKNGGAAILVGVKTDIGRGGSNGAQVTFNLVPQAEREITTKQFSVAWRKEVGHIAGLEKLFFDYLAGPGGAAAINVEVSHHDTRILENAAAELAELLAQYQGVTDINDGFAQGKPQFDYKIRPEGRSLGLSAQELGGQLRHAFYGVEVLRQQRGRNEVKVVVRLPEEERKSLYHLEQFFIRTPDGGEIPLARAAEMTRSRAYTEINRVDGKRVLNVTANVVPEQGNASMIQQNLKAEHFPALQAKHSGLKISFQGRERERVKAVKNLLMGILFVLPAIFCLLAVLFRSYFEAFFVMLSIPFGLVSALLGHVIMGYDLSLISIFGMIALCGVVINGGLVFMVTANNLLAKGETVLESAMLAAIRRFRPIILTALTTFFGLAPMIFEQSIQARFLVPMAISLGYGILFTTVVILYLMPALFVICYDIKGKFGMH